MTKYDPPNASALDKSSVEIRIRMVRADYTSAVHAARNAASWLRADVAERARKPWAASTPGGIAQQASILEAACEKAYALHGVLVMLGDTPGEWPEES